MIRARHRGYGDTADWDLFYASPDEVYVWRAPIAGAEITTPEDAQLVLRAIAKAQINKLDVRGAVFGYYDNNQQGIDVVFTADTILPYTIPQTARRLADAALLDPSLRTRFPALTFPGAKWVELTGPPDALDFWRAHAVLWDDQVGPTDAFAKLEGIYKGEADDGPRLRAWKVKPPDLNGKPANGASGVHWGKVIALAGGAAAIAWVGAKFFHGPGRERSAA